MSAAAAEAEVSTRCVKTNAEVVKEDREVPLATKDEEVATDHQGADHFGDEADERCPVPWCPRSSAVSR